MSFKLVFKQWDRFFMDRVTKATVLDRMVRRAAIRELMDKSRRGEAALECFESANKEGE